MEYGSKGPNVAFFAEVKVIPFMTMLHALRYPAKHHGWFYVRQYNQFISQGWYESAERIIIDPNTGPAKKAQHIRDQFAPIGKELTKRFSDASRYSQLAKFCDAKRFDWQYPNIVDARNRPVATKRLLPPEPVVDSMFADWIDNGKMRCEALESFIVGIWQRHRDLPTVLSMPPSTIIEVPQLEIVLPSFTEMGGVAVYATFSESD